MNYSLFDSSWRDALNGAIFIFVAFMDEKLFTFYCFETFDDCSLHIEARDMKIPPFDASRHGDSGKLCFMPLRFLNDEKMRLCIQKKRLPGDF